MTTEGAMDEVKRVASVYARTWKPIRIPHRGKNPGRDGWQFEVETPESIARWPEPSNVGVILGNVSRGLTDIDLDCPETLVTARYLLPPTKAIFGRKSKPESHYVYYCPDQVTVKMVDVDTITVEVKGETRKVQPTLAELRSNTKKDGALKPGSQTIFPPSTHKSGEPITWNANKESPATVTAEELQRGYYLTCAAGLLARHWPGEGSRQQTALGLGGWLATGGIPLDLALRFSEAVFAAAGCEDLRLHLQAVKDSYAKHAKGENVVGTKVLMDNLTGSADKVLDKVCQWMGFRVKGPDRSRAPDPTDAVFAAESKDLLEIKTHANIEFPIEVFPQHIQDYIKAVSRWMAIDQSFTCMVTLGALALAAQRRLHIEMLPGYFRPLVLQIVVFLRSGERKSPLFDEVCQPIYDFQRVDKERHTQQVGPLLQLIELEKAKGSAASAEALADLQQRLDAVEPAYRTVMQDVTPEMAFRLMYRNRESMALMSDDGKLLNNFIGRYKAGGTDQLDIILKGWDGAPYYYDRVGSSGKPIEQNLDHAKLAILLATQYETLRDLIDPEKPFRARGSMARILPYVAPQRTKPRELRPPPIPQDLRDAYTRTMMNLMRGAPVDALEPDANGNISLSDLEDEISPLAEPVETTPTSSEVLQYSPRILQEKVVVNGVEMFWFDKLRGFAEVAGLPDGMCSEMPDWVGKWIDNSARAIGLLEYIGGAKSQASLTKMCMFFLSHAKRALSQPGTIAPEDSTLSEQCLDLYAKLKELSVKTGKKQLTSREALRAYRKAGTVERLVQLLDYLDKHNYLTLEESPRGKTRASKVIITIHPEDKS